MASCSLCWRWAAGRPPCGGRGSKSHPPEWRSPLLPVALRAEGEDRNPEDNRKHIAISSRPPCGGRGSKYSKFREEHNTDMSPSVRRARIEIAVSFIVFLVPLSPSVRRARIEMAIASSIRRWYASRPPCGGRGSKCLCAASTLVMTGRPPCGGRGSK